MGLDPEMELNVDISIQDIFQGLARTKEFYDELKTKWGKLRRAYQQASAQELDEIAPNDMIELQRQIAILASQIDSFDVGGMRPIPWGRMHEHAAAIEAATEQVRHTLWT